MDSVGARWPGAALSGEVALMDGALARHFFIVYKGLVGAAYLRMHGRERSHALLRAWSYYARPVIDVLWYEDSHPVAVETAHHLIGWLLWLQRLSDPEAMFREIEQQDRISEELRSKVKRQ